MRGGAVSLVLEEIPALALLFRLINKPLSLIRSSGAKLGHISYQRLSLGKGLWEIRRRHLEVITLAHEILHALNSRLEEQAMNYISVRYWRTRTQGANCGSMCPLSTTS